MPHAYEPEQGNDSVQRSHAGAADEARDMRGQDMSQSRRGTHAPAPGGQRQQLDQEREGLREASGEGGRSKDEVHDAPESGDKPESMRSDARR